jgi:hypothetical protein
VRSDRSAHAPHQECCGWGVGCFWPGGRAPVRRRQMREGLLTRFARLGDTEGFPGQLGLSRTGASTTTGWADSRHAAHRRSAPDRSPGPAATSGPLLPGGLMGPDAPGDTTHRDRGLRMGAQVVVPGGILALGPSWTQSPPGPRRRARRSPATCAAGPFWRRCGQHDHGKPRQPAREGVPASSEAVAELVEAVQHPHIDPRHWRRGR